VDQHDVTQDAEENITQGITGQVSVTVRTTGLNKADSNNLQYGSFISSVEVERLVDERIKAVEQKLQADVARIQDHLNTIADTLAQLERATQGGLRFSDSK
jgi:hypothetical protein